MGLFVPKISLPPNKALQPTPQMLHGWGSLAALGAAELGR
jgi:hypothetical protein